MERNVLRKRILARCEKLLETMNIDKEKVMKVLQKHLPHNPTALSILLKKDDEYLKGMMNLIYALEVSKEEFHKIKPEDVEKINTLLQLDNLVKNININNTPPSTGGTFI